MGVKPGQKRPEIAKPLWSRRRKKQNQRMEVKTPEGWMLVSRYTAETFIGRKLKVSEVVHHIDGDRGNDNLNNLQVMTAKEHTILHHTGLKRNVNTRKKISEKAKQRKYENHPSLKAVSQDEIWLAFGLYGKVKDICRFLGITRRTLYNKMDRFGMKRRRKHGRV